MKKSIDRRYGILSDIAIYCYASQYNGDYSQLTPGGARAVAGSRAAGGWVPLQQTAKELEFLHHFARRRWSEREPTMKESLDARAGDGDHSL
jgi:hypothetical protein